MHHHRLILILICSALVLAATPSQPACAQGIFTPWFKVAEFFDEKQLEHDQARLQADLARGDTARMNRDVDRIRRDEWWLGVDRRGQMFGQAPPLPQPSALGASLVPHPLYAGYGDPPSSPAQSFALTRPSPPVNPAQGTAPGTRPHASIVIRNPEPSGISVNYVVDGINYRTESGGFQRLAIGPTSTIAFDRGRDFGVQRHRLSEGTYEFRASDNGWALFKRPSAP